MAKKENKYDSYIKEDEAETLDALERLRYSAENDGHVLDEDALQKAIGLIQIQANNLWGAEKSVESISDEFGKCFNKEDGDIHRWATVHTVQGETDSVFLCPLDKLESVEFDYDVLGCMPDYTIQLTNQQLTFSFPRVGDKQIIRKEEKTS